MSMISSAEFSPRYSSPLSLRGDVQQRLPLIISDKHVRSRLRKATELLSMRVVDVLIPYCINARAPVGSKVREKQHLVVVLCVGVNAQFEEFLE